jgi:inorganic pyrophosphatase
MWTDDDQLNCTQDYNTAFYDFKQRICVLTRRMFEFVAGYGLGGSSVALFGRVGGGIYTKAADVGADLVGKTLQDLKEDDITNPGTIADNVGDNVGDIAGMGSDLFGSLAESTCAALVVSSTSYELVTTKNALFFPISITASGMIASWFSVLLIHLKSVTEKNVQAILSFQIGASTLLETGCVIVPIFILPKTFTFEGGAEKVPLVMERWYAYGCVMFGLWSGMIIGFITNYYTNNAFRPTLHLADACDKGPAPNIILGLALGYLSVVIPIICITSTIAFGFATAGMYGIGLSALGMLGALPVALSVDGFGPISDNAGGVAQMCGLPTEIRDKTDALDAAGNTTAAVGKGFAIGSACLVGLALFGGFITRIEKTSVDILKPTQFAGLLIGAMLPYFFTALTMRAVGDAAYDMMDFIMTDYDRGQETKRAGGIYVPDYEGCIKISTQASLRKMIAPGCLVIGTPIISGFIFGPNATAGVLAGNIVSGVQVAISQSNSGGAWDNAKKEVEANRAKFREEAEKAEVNLDDYRRRFKKLEAERYTGEEDVNGMPIEVEGFDLDQWNTLYNPWMKTDMDLREQHIAAVVGDTVGDPLKDTSGPAINILVKLSAITSLVFGGYLKNYHIFENKPLHEPTDYAYVVKKCNEAGDNPNT